MKALMIFTVCYAGIRLKVRVLPHATDVYREFSGAKKWRTRAALPLGFFQPSHPSSKYTGLIVLAGNEDLTETVPHEVVHAVLHKLGSVESADDEAMAYAVGILSSRINRKIARGVVYE